MADPRTDAEEAIHLGDPRAALARLTEAVRARPADGKLRIFLSQLLCVLGQWERAHTQLNVVAEMDKLAIPMRETVGHAIRCELMRAQVFAGKRTPMVFGQPDQWLALLIESLLQKVPAAVPVSPRWNRMGSPLSRSVATMPSERGICSISRPWVRSSPGSAR